MRKIILLLLTVLTFTSCTESFRDDDIFIVVSKETYSSEKYKYLYRTNHYMALSSSKNDYYFLTEYVFLMNENYELGDTIKFIRHASNEK